MCPDEEVFLFSRAILLRVPSEGAARSVADLRIFKLAIQYNKALTHHHQIACSSPSKSEDAEIAYYMYEVAFQSCKEESKQQGGFSTTLDQGILMLTLFNNM
jgi:hypothetical protein